MDSQTKRTLAATLLCLVALFVWFKIQEVRYRDRLPTTQPAAMIAADEPTSKPVHAAAPATVETKPAEPPALTAPRYRTESADSTATVVLGSDIQDRPGQDDANPYEFAVVVSPIGASVEAIRLANDRNHIAKDPRNPDHDPYGLLEVVRDPETGEVYRSFATEQIRFREEHQKNYEVVGLADVVWSLEKSADDRGETATLRTRIRTEDAAVLELEKVYRLDKGARQLDIFLAVRNLALPTSDILVTERGPIGLKKEDPRSDYRRIVSAIVDAEGVAKLGATMTRAEVFKADEDGRLLRPAEGEKLLWAAASNKFFTCIVTPLLENPSEPSADEAVAGTVGRLAAAACFKDPKAADDLTFDWVMASSRPLRKGQRLTLHLDAFCGPKSDKLFETMPDRNYHIVRDADSRWCTFQAITTLMLWLLNAIYGVTHNYGVAIIVLVIIVRLVLHPISRHGQITMMKMQKNQQRIKPKIDALQRQYKNDKQKLNEETMKLYREEGINPAGTILGCLPMALQMPIWVALWTALNTNVHMRHMPFFGYIRDLSAPDALIGFAHTYNIPVLHYLMGPISSFNLLPIIMTALMYGQQKFTQMLTKPDKPAEPKLDKDGKPVPDQLAQQQKMMSFMMVFMGLMFYSFPSGLCLYILSSSLLGMGEQFYIRKHIKEQELRGAFERKKKAERKPGFLGRKIAELQKAAEEARLAQAGGPRARQKKQRKKARF